MKKFSCLFQRDCLVEKFRSGFLIGPLFLLCLTLIGCGGGGSNNNITVSPGEVTLAPGGTQQFSATVTGLSNTAVTWSVDPQTGGGDITSDGFYTAPETDGTYYVVATSQADPTKFDKARVNVVTGGGGGGHYYAGTITIERTGYCAGNDTTYNESAIITNFHLIDGGNGLWVLTGQPSTVTAYVDDNMDSGAHVDYPLTTKVSTKTSIMLSINSGSGTYDLMIGVYAEGAIVTPVEGPPSSMDWPIAVAPIQNQTLPVNLSHITGSIVQTEIANCTVEWDLTKN